jgi:hypothetical protein
MNLGQSFKIALDIDGVVCDWWGGIIKAGKTLGLQDQLPRSAAWVHRWHGEGEAFDQVWNAVKGSKEWWMSLDPIKGAREAINFHVDAYITARPIPSQWSMDWLNRVGLGRSDSMVYTMKPGIKKVRCMLNEKITFIVDDKPGILEECRATTDAAVGCFLMDQPWNRMHDDKGWRIKSLKEVPERIGYLTGAPPMPKEDA